MPLWIYYGPFSLILSLILSIVMMKNSKFKSLFYKFVQIDMVVNILIYVNFATYKLVASDIWREEIMGFMEKHYVIRIIRDFICNWCYHFQSSSILMKCVFRYTLAKYPNAPEIWSMYFPIVVIGMFIYSVVVAIPYQIVLYDDTETHLYSIFMNVETTVYFICTLTVGYLTHKALKYRSAEFTKTIRKMNRYLFFDLLIHVAVFLGVLLPAFIFHKFEKYIKENIMMLLVDLVALSPPYILIFCDNNIRDLVKCRKRNQVVHVMPSEFHSTVK